MIVILSKKDERESKLSKIFITLFLGKDRERATFFGNFKENSTLYLFTVC